MASFKYPSNDLESPVQTLAALGSHWRNVYRDSLVESFTYATAQEALQTQQNLLEAIDAISRDDIPVFHTENWYRLVVKESDLNTSEANFLRYGDSTENPIYGPQTDTNVTHKYGERNPNIFAFPLPTELKDCDIIFSGVQKGATSYVTGQDFILEYSSVIFKQNPFEDSNFEINNVYSGADVIDREAVLWVFKAKLERNYVTDHFGHTLGYNLPSSQDYKNLVNAAYDSIVGGTAKIDIDLALSALTGVEVVRNEEETVEHILRDLDNLVIVTDKSAYRYHRQADAIVAVGDKVGSGDYLTDSVVIHELNRAELPSFLTRLNFSPDYLSPGFDGEITFENANKTITTETLDSKTKVSFEIGGFPSDVDRFFDIVHERGLGDGKTLAQFLDIRGDDQNSEPTSDTLPSTINPLQFLVDNLLRFNLFAVKIQPHSINTELGLSRTRIFRKMLPPWTAVVILYELEADDDPVIMDGAGSSTDPGYTESPTSFTSTSVPETLDPSCTGSAELTVDLYADLSVDAWEALGLSDDSACVSGRPKVFHINGACK